jgi:hypothetical protein
MTNLEKLREGISKIRPNEVDSIIERLLKERQLDEGTIDACSNEEWANEITEHSSYRILIDAFVWSTIEDSFDFWNELHKELINELLLINVVKNQ